MVKIMIPSPGDGGLSALAAALPKGLKSLRHWGCHQWDMWGCENGDMTGIYFMENPRKSWMMTGGTPMTQVISIWL